MVQTAKHDVAQPPHVAPGRTPHTVGLPAGFAPCWGCTTSPATHFSLRCELRGCTAFIASSIYSSFSNFQVLRRKAAVCLSAYLLFVGISVPLLTVWASQFHHLCTWSRWCELYLLDKPWKLGPFCTCRLLRSCSHVCCIFKIQKLLCIRNIALKSKTSKKTLVLFIYIIIRRDEM